MWQDAFATRSGAWDISLTPVLLQFAMIAAVPVGLYCCIVLWARRTKKSDAP